MLIAHYSFKDSLNRLLSEFGPIFARKSTIQSCASRVRTFGSKRLKVVIRRLFVKVRDLACLYMVVGGRSQHHSLSAHIVSRLPASHDTCAIGVHTSFSSICHRCIPESLSGAKHHPGGPPVPSTRKSHKK